jgi:hypothetical protein
VDLAGLELIAADDGHGPVMRRVIAVVSAIIEVVVDEKDGPVIPAERAPADVIVVPPPVDPGRAPVIVGDPIPAQAEAPVPSPVVVDRPSPGLGGHPGPAHDGIPDPAAIEIGPPVAVRDIGHPDVAIATLVDPSAVLVELLLVLLDLGREILPRAPGREQAVPRVVPILERVAAAGVVSGIVEELPGGGGHGFTRPDEDGAVLRGGLEAALADHGLGLLIEYDLEAVEPLLEDVKRGVGRMDLDALVRDKLAHPEIRAPLDEMEADALVALRRQDGEFDLGVGVETEIVPAPEMDLGLAALGPHRVALDQGEIDLALFVSQVRRPLDIDGAVDIAQAGEAVGIEPFVLGPEAEGDGDDDHDGQDRRLRHRLAHLFSPSDPL